MAIPKQLKNYTAYVDGIGYAGIVSQGEPPSLTLRVEEYAGGGMAAPVDLSLGMTEKMECTLTLAEYNSTLYEKFGHEDVPLTLRGSQGDGEGVIFEMRGLIREVEPSAFEVGKNTLKITMTATYCKVTIGGRELVEVDAINMVFKSGGVDHMENTRQALGL